MPHHMPMAVLKNLYAGVCAAAPIGYYCWKCASSAASNDYNEVMDAGDGWEDEPLDGSILEEE